MPCYHPMPAFQDRPGSDVRLSPPVGTATLSLPCGTCLGCRSARATAWAARCVHEAGESPHNCFVTLTYDDAHVPDELVPRHLALFLKRLRKALAGRVGGILSSGSSGLRYFACGEYGEANGRPHYHALLFNCDFDDTHVVGKGLRESVCLARLWPFGKHALGTCTGASANYIAQYSLKKQGRALDCDADGVVRLAPFLRMSTRPAIGARWLFRYLDDLKGGFLLHGSSRAPIPRYYRKQLAAFFPAYAESLSVQSLRGASSDRFSPERLLASEAIHFARKRLTDHRSL